MKFSFMGYTDVSKSIVMVESVELGIIVLHESLKAKMT